MCGSIVCLAAALLGVDARWPPLPGGGSQYVIQIEPHALDRRESHANDAVRSYVPPYVRDVRAYRIVMGTDRLAKNDRTADVQSLIQTGVDTDWIRLPAGRVECRVWIHPQVLDELEKPGRVIEGKIPASVKKLSVFTISVGTKPPAAPLPETNGANPLGRAEATADRLPAEPPPFRWPHTPAAPAAPGAAPSPPPSEAAPPHAPSDPPAFKPDAGSTPMPVQPANHVEQLETTPDDRSQEKADSKSIAKKESSPQEPARPWLPLAVTLIGLSASLGGNLFLLWVMRDSRSRYRALLRRMGEVRDIVSGCVRELERAG